MITDKHPAATDERGLRIAVLADTHDDYPPELTAMLSDADEIWHLGDVCAPTTLDEFAALGVPMLVVRGNNDSNLAWPLTMRIERSGRRFHLEHIAPRRAPAAAEFVLCGHTHKPQDNTDANGVRWLNPGCVSHPRGMGRSFAWLRVSAAGEVEWQTVLL